MELIILIVAIAVPAYLLGSIPFGHIISKRKGIDIQQVGSGNIGATNVWRTFGWKWGALTLLGDTVKGFIAVTLVSMIFETPAVGWYILAGSSAILGHFKPVWLKWKGGKSVSTSLGVILALLQPWFVLVVLGTFGLILLLSKQVSLGSIGAALVAVTAKIVFGGGFSQESFETTTFVIGVAALIVVTHLPNIKRLLDGTERKII